MSGHLFVTRGSLTSLACDAILVPSGIRNGRFGNVAKGWWSVPRLPLDTQGFVTPAPNHERRAVEVAHRQGSQDPAIWVGHTGETGLEPPPWYGAAVAQFVRDASRQLANLEGDRPLGDPRPLLGLPLIGTGQGGMRDRKGEVVLAVVQAILDEFARTDADVVLVLYTSEAYAATQQARAQLMGSDWPSLDAEQLEVARDLAREARHDRLVLFMGAGTSVGAGLPSWKQLIGRLGDKAGMTSEAEQAELLALDPRDAGVVVDRRLRKQQRSLAGEIGGLVKRTRVSLTHQLLASLPVTEAATTNYDVLFEKAWDDAGRRHAVLPKESVRDAPRWLLKLHGSIDDPDRIVLSRDDYLRFEGEGVALAGVIQAMLLTRHMLFVGYSLSDDNFHRLVHQVRRAVGGAADRPGGQLGTALTPTSPRLAQDVWGDDVRFVSTAGDSEADVRRLAILLDYIGLESADPAAHVLDDTYKALFSSDELALRDRLWETRDAAQANDVRLAVRRAVEDALASLRASDD
jgi:hypothetical protein